jgi:hypothetical protein
MRGLNEQERIVCAAIHYEDGIRYTHKPTNIDTGFVVTGLRHSNCGYTMYILTGDIKRRLSYRKYTEGFLTTHNRFLNRNGAFIVAKKSGQIGNKHGRQELASEDLY